MPVGTSAVLTRTDAVTLATTETPVAAAPRSKLQNLNVQLGKSATILRTPSIRFTAVQPQTSATTRSKPQQLAATQPQTPSTVIGRVIVKLLATTQQAGHGIVNQTLSAAAAAVVTLTALRVVPRTLTSSQADTATVTPVRGKVLQTGSMIPLPPVFQSIGQVASLVRIALPGRTLAAIQPQQPVLTRRMAATRTTTQPQTATLQKLIPRIRAAASATVATLSRLRGQAAAAQQPSTATTARSSAHTTTTAAAPLAAVEKRGLVTLAASAVSAIATALGQKIAQVRTVTATDAATTTLVRSVGRRLQSGPVAAAATATKQPAVAPATAVQPTLAAPVSRRPDRLLQTVQPQTATRTTSTRRILATSQAVTVSMTRTYRRLRTFAVAVRTRARLETDHPAIFRHGHHHGRIIGQAAGRIVATSRGRIATLFERDTT